MVKQDFLWELAVLVMLVAAVTVFASVASGSDGGTQIFSPAQYSIMQAEINVSSLENLSGPTGNRQSMLFKIDNSTGAVWALQIAVNSPHDPTVRSAAWYPVSAQASSFNNTAPEGGGFPMDNL